MEIIVGNYGWMCFVFVGKKGNWRQQNKKMKSVLGDDAGCGEMERYKRTRGW